MLRGAIGPQLRVFPTSSSQRTN